MIERTGSRGRVLVVEDEPYVRDSLVEMLRSRRFEAAAAASVADALSHLGRAPVDVVLSDLRMPGADGLELVRRMQTAAPDVPVVILTGHGNVASAVECLKAGASDYILKPAEPEALEVALDRALEARALRREVRYLRSTVAAQAEAAIGESAPWRRVTGDGRSRGADRLRRAGHRRVRHRQGAAGPAPARPLAPLGRAVRQGQLRGRAARAVGERVLRPPQGLVRGRGDRPRGPLPARGPRHAAARRGRRDAGGRAGQAAARDPGRRVRAAGRRAGDARRRARGRLDQQRPRGGGAAGPLPRRPLLPPQRGAHRRAAAARAPRRHPAARAPLRATRSRGASAGPRPRSRRRRSPGSRPTPGRATSASCAT